MNGVALNMRRMHYHYTTQCFKLQDLHKKTSAEAEVLERVIQVNYSYLHYCLEVRASWVIC